MRLGNSSTSLCLRLMTIHPAVPLWSIVSTTWPSRKRVSTQPPTLLCSQHYLVSLLRLLLSDNLLRFLGTRIVCRWTLLPWSIDGEVDVFAAVVVLGFWCGSLTVVHVTISPCRRLTLLSCRPPFIYYGFFKFVLLDLIRNTVVLKYELFWATKYRPYPEWNVKASVGNSQPL